MAARASGWPLARPRRHCETTCVTVARNLLGMLDMCSQDVGAMVFIDPS
jgi:hypothetical protein